MKKRTEKISGILPLLLFAVAAVCVFFVLLAGVGVYTRLNGRDEAAYEKRTAAGYLTEKVRQCSGNVHWDALDGTGALVLEEGEFLTRIYCHEGWLWELYSEKDSGAGPEDGEQILPLRSLEGSLEEGLLTLALTLENGEEQKILLHIRGVAS